MMPHCIIEYAKTLENEIKIEHLMRAVLEGAEQSLLFNVADIKVRAKSYQDYLMPEEGQRFIHVRLQILSGRTPAQREYLSQQVLASVKSLYIAAVTLSVEVFEMERQSYIKHQQG